jgi:hypothetical protein
MRLKKTEIKASSPSLSPVSIQLFFEEIFKVFWYLFYVLPVELRETSCKSVDFLLTENIKRGN